MKRILGLVFCCVFAACGGQALVANEELEGSSEVVNFEPLGDDGSGKVPESAVLEVTAPVNLRESPSTDARIILIVPQDTTVTVLNVAPDGGFYNVSYLNYSGWVYGAYLTLSPPIGSMRSALTTTEQDYIMSRAWTAVGSSDFPAYSYWWGHGRFGCNLASGSCSGDCPSCTHYGVAGADCSGMVAQAWNTPPADPASAMCNDRHPYDTTYFYYNRPYWSQINRDSAGRADSFVSLSHMLIRNSEGDNWNNVHAFECAGCSLGCLHRYRSVSSAYIAIRRHTGWL
jgi:hypothetical protein